MNIEILEPSERETAEERADREAYEREQETRRVSNFALGTLRRMQERKVEAIRILQAEADDCEGRAVAARADMAVCQAEIAALEDAITKLETPPCRD